MAGTSSGGGSGSGKVPPRPGGSRPVPKRPTGKPSTFTARPGGRPQPRAASARQAVQAQRQRRIYFATAGVCLVIVVIAIFVTAKLASSNNGGNAAKGNTKLHDSPGTFALTAADIDPVEAVTVKTMVANAKAVPAADASAPAKLPAGTAAYTQDGKPRILYVGAEFCPYCAGERWAMVMALSKFGTFHDLRGTTSSSTDTNASTPTFSFYGSTYSSPYVVFTSVEQTTNTHANLQSTTAAENVILEKYDSAGTIPFIYMAGKYMVTDIQYNAARIASESFLDAANYLTAGNNPTSEAAEASAGKLVGDICAMTDDQPAKVCSLVPTSLKGVTSTSKGHGGSSLKTTTTAKPTTTISSTTISSTTVPKTPKTSKSTS